MRLPLLLACLFLFACDGGSEPVVDGVYSGSYALPGLTRSGTAELSLLAGSGGTISGGGTVTTPLGIFDVVASGSLSGSEFRISLFGGEDCRFEGTVTESSTLDGVFDGAGFSSSPVSLRRIAAYSEPEAPGRSCCRVCTTGKACGDSCISRSKSCNKSGGCACNG